MKRKGRKRATIKRGRRKNFERIRGSMIEGGGGSLTRTRENWSRETSKEEKENKVPIWDAWRLVWGRSLKGPHLDFKWKDSRAWNWTEG